MRVSKSGLELIKRFEGFRRSAARLADGRWTVGYGHVKFAKDGVELTEKDAEALLLYDLIEISGAVNDLVFAPLTQNQFDALVSFAFNVGVENLRASSVLRRLNEGEAAKAAFELEAWRRSDFGGAPLVVDALVRRRAAEKALFLTPDSGFVPAPTPALPPALDPDADLRPPVEAPAQLYAPLEGASADAVRPADETPAEEPAADAPGPEAETPAEPPAPIEEQPAPPPEEEGPIAEFPRSLGPIQPVRAAPAPGVGLRQHRRVRSQRKSLAPVVATGVAGVFLFGFAIFWRLNAGAEHGQTANAQAVSYISGILGFICILGAAWMAMDRFAGDDI